MPGNSGSNLDHTRDPCPYVIVYDVGIGFGIGAILGTLGNTYKGYRNSPRGERWQGVVSAVKTRAPITGGNFAVWSGLFNACDCAFVHLRGKEDAWNPIMAGATTGALLAVRSGPVAIAFSGLIGGVFLAAMEGAAVMMGKMAGGSIDPQPIVLPEQHQQSQQQQKEESVQQPRRGLFASRFGFA